MNSDSEKTKAKFSADGGPSPLPGSLTPPNNNAPEISKLYTPTSSAEATPTLPATGAPGAMTASGRTLHNVPDALPINDLTSDVLLSLVPRQTVKGRSVPILDGIVLVRKLGQGGMGAVYKGFHCRLGKKVAVKILPLQGSMQPETVHRFYREAQLAAQVQSPHLVGVLDVNEQNGLSYIVMELVEGLSAQDEINRVRASGPRGLPEVQALDICIAIARGISVAHAAGIIHRDVKPDNILLPYRSPSENTGSDKKGEVLYSAAKLADLGLARHEGMGTTLTGATGGMGTPGYLAPEQALKASSAGKPADVFGLGAALYALLCGHAPFYGAEAMQVIMSTLQEPHQPIQTRRPDVSLTTHMLLERCLCKNPKARFPDGAALLGALQSCRDVLGQPSSKQQAVVALWDETQGSLPTAPTPVVSEPKVEESHGIFDSAMRLLRRTTNRAYWRSMSRGHSSLEKKDWVHADEYFRTALDAIPGDIHAKEGIQSAQVGISEMRFKTALTQAEQAISKKDWESAHRAYKLALNERPQHVGTLAGRERVFYLQAIHQAQQELKSIALNGQGRYLEIESGCRNRVEKLLADALILQPNDRTALELLEKIGEPLEIQLNLGDGVSITLVRVPAGEFDMGSPEGGQYERPVRRVKLTQSFYLTKFPITVQQFRRFVQCTEYITAVERAGKGLGVETGDWDLQANVNWKQPGYAQTDDCPVVLLSWFDTQQFCQWLTKSAVSSWTSRQKSIKSQLPSEAQWEYATRGAQNLRYTWGLVWDGRKANHADATLHARGVHLPCSTDNDGYAFTSPVGHYDNASWCGAEDLIGNVWEWCQDWHQDDYYQIAVNTDPQGPLKGASRVLRGGSWADMPLKCRAYVRRGAPPEGATTNIGFRVAVNF